MADSDERRDDEGLVTLMTLHNAKGLEYPIVFIIGCEEGVFPHSRSLDEGTLEEERRLCYVGITRGDARPDLHPRARRNVFGSATTELPSRFLAEIPADLVDREEPSGVGARRRRRRRPSARDDVVGARPGAGRGVRAVLPGRRGRRPCRASATAW